MAGKIKLSKKDFIPVVIITAIALVLSMLLTVLNFALYVSPEERTMRAIKKIYGAEKEYEVILDASKEGSEAWTDAYGYGKVSLLYKVDGENGFDYLIKSTGFNGYKGGTITCWVVVSVSNTEKKITKVILDSYEKQTLMSKFNANFWENMYVDVTDDYDAWFVSKMTDEILNQNPNAVHNPMSGASMSGTAGCNAINCAIACVNNFDFGGNA